MNYHPAANIFPMLSNAEFSALVEDIRANGLRESIKLCGGSIIDGRNRYRACIEADVEPRFENYGGSDPIRYVVSLNLHRRHLTESQRAMVAAVIANMEHGGDRREQAANLPLDPTPHQPAVTQAEAAELLNVSERTVRAARKVQNEGAPELVAAVQAGDVSVSAAADVATLPVEEQVEIVAAGSAAVVNAAKEIRHHRTQFTGEEEWYTPREYLDSVVSVLGAIDLDPASSAMAQVRVGAARFFSVDDDGLAQEWRGRVWMNPPYSRGLIDKFISKAVSEYRAGRVSEAILLTHNYTDTGWFHEAVGAASALCFTKGRVKFIGSDGRVAAPTQGQAFFYFGNNPERFASVFARHGFVVSIVAREAVNEAA